MWYVYVEWNDNFKNVYPPKQIRTEGKGTNYEFVRYKDAYDYYTIQIINNF